MFWQELSKAQGWTVQWDTTWSLCLLRPVTSVASGMSDHVWLWWQELLSRERWQAGPRRLVLHFQGWEGDSLNLIMQEL